MQPSSKNVIYVLRYSICMIFIHIIHIAFLFFLELGNLNVKLFKKATLKLLQVMSLNIQYWKHNMRKGHRIITFFDIFCTNLLWKVSFLSTSTRGNKECNKHQFSFWTLYLIKWMQISILLISISKLNLEIANNECKYRYF